MVYSVKVDQNNIVTHCFVGEVPGLLGSDTPVGIGWVWDGSTFSEPAPAVPQAEDYPLKRWQFHAMLEILGMTDMVQAAIAAIPDPAQRAVAKSKLAYADVFERNDPVILQLAPATGLTDAEIDAAWLQAKDLT